MDRKYKHRGYQSSDEPQKKDKRPHEGHPRQEQIGPRTPRMVGTITRARCSNCGTVLAPGFDPKGKCPRCAFDLHCCKQCAYFEPSTRFQCVKPVPVRIVVKDQGNDCTLFKPRVTVARDSAAAPPAASNQSGNGGPAPRNADDARAAFDSLFKKS